MTIRKLLVTGASGFLGWNLCSIAKKDWITFGTVYSHPVTVPGVEIEKIDLADLSALERLYNDIMPDAVIHTAAAASPDFCELNRGASEKINITTPAFLARLCAGREIPFVFTSTDLVFDGLHAPYHEEDPVSPINCYGRQKAEAEQQVLAAYPDAAVCRMPLMFGDPGPAASSFFQSMVHALKEGKSIPLFEDEFRTPVSAGTAAQGLLLMTEKGQGIMHLGGVERISRYHFGLLLMDALQLKEAKIIRCGQKDVQTSAPRAPDLSLDSSKAFALGYTPLPLQKQLASLFA